MSSFVDQKTNLTSVMSDLGNELPTGQSLEISFTEIFFMAASRRSHPKIYSDLKQQVLDRAK